MITPREAASTVPLTKDSSNAVARGRRDVVESLEGGRFLAIVGPCSVHSADGALEYATRLARLASEIAPVVCVVMRVYVEKTRSLMGWRGMLRDPRMDGSDAVDEGIVLSRTVLSRISSLGLPCGAELVDPLTFPYIADFLSWGAVGARCTESQTHREAASSYPFAIGFKNPTSGELAPAVSGAMVASQMRTLVGIDSNGKVSLSGATGNPLAHLILRGGNSGSNLGLHAKAARALGNSGLEPAVLVDTGHDNARSGIEGMARNAVRIAQVRRASLSRLRSGTRRRDEGSPHERSPGAPRGIMMESYLEAGRQEPRPNGLGMRADQSVTDPCVGWDMTRDTLLRIRDILA